MSLAAARWDTNMAVVSLRSDYNRHVCAPYLGVSCLQEIFAFGVKLEECE